jgi:hypothetical protein
MIVLVIHSCLKEALLEDGFWSDDPTLGFDD